MSKELEQRRRYFSEKTLKSAFTSQEGKCKNCGTQLKFGEDGEGVPFEADHDDGNRSNNTLSNCVLLCHPCHSATFHSIERDNYLKDLGFLKEKVQETINLATSQKTNGTVLDSVHSLLKEYKLISEQIAKLSGGAEILKIEEAKGQDILDLEAKLERLVLERKIKDLQVETPLPTKEYMSGFEDGLRKGVEIGLGAKK